MRLLVSAIGVSAALLVSGVGYCAEAGPSDAPSVEAEGKIEEVLVSARKRTESMQKTPVALTVLGDGIVNSPTVLKMVDLGRQVPNVLLEDAPTSSRALTATIRGIGFNDVEKFYDPVVGVTLDGVVIATNTGASFEAQDIEAIEVLRGPQGTLFGRNTTAGMINVRRTRPTGNWGADLKIDYGQYNRRNYGLVVNLPKVANIATKLYGFRKKADQFMTNIVTGDRAHGDNQTNYGASFLWTPTDDLDVQLSVDRYKDRSHYTSSFALSLPGNFFCDAFGIGLGLTSVCAPGSGDIVKASGYKRSFSPPGLSNIYMPMSGDNVILNANWDLGAYTLTSVTGFLSERDQKNSELSGAVDTVGGTPVVGTNGITYFVGGAPVFEVRRQENLTSSARSCGSRRNGREG